MDWLIPTLRLLFFTRFSILVALAATVLMPLAAAAKPELLGSLLVLEEPWQLFNVTWASLVLAIFVLVSFRITQVNASARFPDYRATLAQEKRAGDVSPRSGGRQETVGRRQEPGGNRLKSGVTVAARARLAFRTLLAAVIARLRVSSTPADRIIPRRVVPAVPGAHSVAEFVRIQERGASVSIQTTPALEGDSGILTNSATTSSPATAGWRYRWLFLAMIGLPLPIACVWHTARDLSPAWTDRPAPAGVLVALAMIGGVVVATLVLGLLLVSQQLLLDPKSGVVRFVAVRGVAVVRAAQANPFRQVPQLVAAVCPLARAVWAWLHAAIAGDGRGDAGPGSRPIGPVAGDRRGGLSLQLSWPALGAQFADRGRAVLGSVLLSRAARALARAADRSVLLFGLLPRAGVAGGDRLLGRLLVAVRHRACLRTQAGLQSGRRGRPGSTCRLGTHDAVRRLASAAANARGRDRCRWRNSGRGMDGAGPRWTRRDLRSRFHSLGRHGERRLRRERRHDVLHGRRKLDGQRPAVRSGPAAAADRLVRDLEPRSDGLGNGLSRFHARGRAVLGSAARRSRLGDRAVVAESHRRRSSVARLDPGDPQSSDADPGVQCGPVGDRPAARDFPRAARSARRNGAPRIHASSSISIRATNRTCGRPPRPDSPPRSLTSARSAAATVRPQARTPPSNITWPMADTARTRACSPCWSGRINS